MSSPCVITPTFSVSWLCGGMTVPPGYEANRTSQFFASSLNASNGPSNGGRSRSSFGKCGIFAPCRLPSLRLLLLLPHPDLVAMQEVADVRLRLLGHVPVRAGALLRWRGLLRAF